MLPRYETLSALIAETSGEYPYDSFRGLFRSISARASDRPGDDVIDFKTEQLRSFCDDFTVHPLAKEGLDHFF